MNTHTTPFNANPVIFPNILTIRCLNEISVKTHKTPSKSEQMIRNGALDALNVKHMDEMRNADETLVMQIDNCHCVFRLMYTVLISFDCVSYFSFSIYLSAFLSLIRVLPITVSESLFSVEFLRSRKTLNLLSSFLERFSLSCSAINVIITLENDRVSL